MADDIRDTLIERLESLNRVMPEYRKLNDEVRGLKAEVATLNAKLAATGKVSVEEFSDLVKRALDCW